jgi:cytochrome c oxidase cbb3-type subunit 4
MEEIRTIQGYAYFFFMLFLVVLLYGYIIHLYRSEKKGERDYEKYANLATHDDLNSTPVEEVEKKKEN